MSEIKEAERGEVTRQALIEAAIEVFARDGYHAASTRRLASAAGVNLAMINYHFKSKQGLYLAVFEYIVNQIWVQIHPIEQRLKRCLEQNDWKKTSPKKRKELLFPFLLEVSDRALKLLTSEKTNGWAQLIIHEQQQPTAAFEFFYPKFFAPMVTVFALVIQIIRDIDMEESTLIALSILGQLLVWRVARTGIIRKMNWTTIDEKELEKVQKIIHRNITAMVLMSGEMGL